MFSKFCLKIFLLVPIICLARGSDKEFCQLKELKSVFNIDKQIFVAVSGNHGYEFWRYDPESNVAVIDDQMQSIVSKINFNGIV